MKKLLIIAGIVLVSFTVNAQKTYIQGGLNLANISKSSNGKTEKNNLLPSFNTGIMHRFKLSDPFEIESGLLYTGKGSKAETYFTNNDYVKSKFNPRYMELPVNFVLNLPVDKSSAFFVHAGPYIAVGVGGKSKTETKVLSIVTNSEKSIAFSNDDPFTSQQEDASYNKLKRFDFGLNFGGGIEFEKLMLKANYGMGFSKINSTEGNNSVDDKNKFRTISISAGIPLGKK